MGSGQAGRVWGKYFILPDRFGFEEMKSVDCPLCGRIGRFGWSGLSGRERSGDRVLTISSNSNYKVKKRKKKFNQQPQISKSEQIGWRSHLLRWGLFQIRWDLSRSGEILLDWWDLAWRCSVRCGQSCGAWWRRSSRRGDRDSVSLTMNEREREREQLRMRPCGYVGNGWRH